MKGQKTGGRQKGTPNKASADVKALAQIYTEEAIDKLAALMRGAESQAVQREAARDLLERGHGRPVQALEHTGGGGGPIKIIGGLPEN